MKRLSFTVDDQPSGSVILGDDRILKYVIEDGPLRAGHEVHYRTDRRAALRYKVLAIQADDPNPARQWAVIAFKTDIPVVVPLDQVVRCVD